MNLFIFRSYSKGCDIRKVHCPKEEVEEEKEEDDDYDEEDPFVVSSVGRANHFC